MEKFRALIFDLDGVIIDTEPLHAEAKRLAFKKYGIVVPETLYAEFRGRSDEDMAEYVVREFAQPPLTAAEVLASKHALFATLHESIRPVADAVEFIRAARSQFEKLALTTSATKKNQQFAFERFGLQPFFDVVVTAEEVRQTKPHPAPYLATVERLHLPAPDCLVIEDSKNGIIAAKLADCPVAAITTSFTSHELRSANPDYLVESFKALAGLLAIDI